jgi:hypothetical protein
LITLKNKEEQWLSKELIEVNDIHVHVEGRWDCRSNVESNVLEKAVETIVSVLL